MRYVLFLLVIFILASFLVTKKFIYINEYTCQSQFGLCRKDLIEQIGANKGQDILKAFKSTRETLEQSYLIDEYYVQFKIPDKLVVSVVEKKPWFSLKASDKELFALVDRQGYVLDVNNKTSLPYVIGGEFPDIGNKVSGDELFALKLISDLFSLYKVKVAKLESDGIYVKMPDGITVIFPLNGDRQLLLGSLKLIFFKLNTVKEDSKIDVIREIDLRFKNPILR
jgi:cell division septal protein FtsQ